MASAVRADFITGSLANAPINGGILNPGAAVKINLGNGAAPSINYYPGEVNWTVAKGPSGQPNASWVPGVGSSFQSFCIELTQNISPGNTYTYSLVNLASAPSPGSPQNGSGAGMGQAKANAIAALWAADFGSIAKATGNQANIDGAAFQLAIWKIEYDWGSSNESFSKGNFQASAISGNANSAAALTQSQNWLNSLGWNNTKGWTNEANLVGLSSPHYQDQVMALPMPVPPTFWLAGIAGVVLLIYVYWCHRSATGITLQ